MHTAPPSQGAHPLGGTGANLAEADFHLGELGWQSRPILDLDQGQALVHALSSVLQALAVAGVLVDLGAGGEVSLRTDERRT
eukprot:12640568-Alexandrium_andersonii.AAC.1